MKPWESFERLRVLRQLFKNNLFFTKAFLLFLMPWSLVHGESALTTQIIGQEDSRGKIMFGSSVAIHNSFAVVSGMKADVQLEDSSKVKRHAGKVYVYEYRNDSWEFLQSLNASDADANDNFGFSVDISVDVIAVGSWHSDSDDAFDSGAVYIYERDAEGGWVERQKLISPALEKSAHFGVSVALDSNRLIVGAHRQTVLGVQNAGAAYVYERSSQGWQLVSSLSSPSPTNGQGYGRSVELNDMQLFVGAPGSNVGAKKRSGSIDVFEFNKSVQNWTFTQSLTASDASGGDLFAEHLSVYDNTLAVGAWHEDTNGSNAGALYIFNRKNNEWVETEKIVVPDGAENDRLGFRVGVHSKYLVAGAYNGGATYGAVGSGTAYVYKKINEKWEFFKQLSPVKDPGSEFGRSIATFNEHILVGAEKKGPGTAYFFRDFIDAVESEDF